MIITAQRIFFCLLLMFIGFCAGMYVASFLVRSAIGFTGSPDALAYGLAGLVTGLIAGVLLSRVMKPTMFRNALIIAFTLSIIICAFIFYRLKQINHQQTRIEEVNLFSKSKVTTTSTAFLSRRGIISKKSEASRFYFWS